MVQAAGGLIPIHPNEFYLQNWTLVGVCMGSGYGEKLVEIEEAAHAALLELVARGLYRSTPTRIISLEQVPKALRDLRERRTLGRVVARLEEERGDDRDHDRGSEQKSLHPAA